MSFKENFDVLSLESMESRVETLERLIYGKSFVTKDSPPIINSLLTANTLLTAAANRCSNIKSVYQRLPELNRNLTEDALGDPLLEYERKLNVILSLEDQCRQNVAILERIVKLHNEFNQGNLKSLDEHRAKLVDVKEQLSGLRDGLEAMDARHDQLMSTWHNLVTEISRVMLATNNDLTKWEATILQQQQH